VQRAVERVAREVDEVIAARVSDVIRRIFGRVLKELADLDNPMRAPIGDEPGSGGLFEPLPEELPTMVGVEVPLGSVDGDGNPHPPEPPDLDELDRRPAGEDAPLPQARPDRRRSTSLPTIAPDPTPGSGRSRFDAEAGVVLYNEAHPDYLFVKDEEGALVDYLAVLVAKEYIVYNNPRASADEVTEEMVRILVRLRRHLSGRR
jgi:hypothetical protein